MSNDNIQESRSDEFKNKPSTAARESHPERWTQTTSSIGSAHAHQHSKQKERRIPYKKAIQLHAVK